MTSDSTPQELLNPDMPADELRLHMGELTSDEVLVARAAIRWANTRLSADDGAAAKSPSPVSVGEVATREDAELAAPLSIGDAFAAPGKPMQPVNETAKNEQVLEDRLKSVGDSELDEAIAWMTGYYPTFVVGQSYAPKIKALFAAARAHRAQSSQGDAETEFVLERYRRGVKMAEGARVKAKSLDEAVARAKKMFCDCLAGCSCPPMTDEFREAPSPPKEAAPVTYDPSIHEGMRIVDCADTSGRWFKIEPIVKYEKAQTAPVMSPEEFAE